MSQLEAEEARAAFLQRWSLLIGRFFSLQLLIMALNFVAGMLLVRWLAKDQYALVNIANTMLGAMSVLSNLGISIGVTAIGGRVCHDPQRFGGLLRTAMRLRWRLAAVTLPVVCAIMLASLHSAGATTAQTALLTAVVVASATIELGAALFGSALLLRGRSGAYQAIEAGAAAVRLVLILALAGCGWLAVTSALAASLAAAALRRRELGRRLRRDVDLGAAEDPADGREIMRLMRLETPNAIFYCFQGQIVIWIMAWFGAVAQIAEIGALGRLSVALSLFTAFFSTVLVPAYARVQDPATLRRRYAGMVALALAISALAIAVAWLVPATILLLLGPQYANLTAELPLMVANVMFSFVIGTLWALNSARAWIVATSRGNIAGTVLCQVALAALLDLRTLHGLIWFTLVSQVPIFLLCLADAWLGLRAARRAGAAADAVVAG